MAVMMPFAMLGCSIHLMQPTLIETADAAGGSKIKIGEPLPTDPLTAFIAAHQLSLDDYPDSLKELLRKNPETEEFVLNYPLRKDDEPVMQLSDAMNSDSLPLFMQWDRRWGYMTYGNDLLGITGCGPTCLSMVAFYLLNDPKLTPAWMAQFSRANGYCVYGNGTAWTLMSEGAGKLGLNAVELPLDENRMVKELTAGHPIICIMGPGEFTDSGHYIVLTGWSDGQFTVNDPNSHARSERLWRYDEIKGQIRNLWAYSVG